MDVILLGFLVVVMVTVEVDLKGFDLEGWPTQDDLLGSHLVVDLVTEAMLHRNSTMPRQVTLV